MCVCVCVCVCSADSPQSYSTILSVPEKAEVYLSTEKGTVGFLLTQTVGGREEGWMEGWMKVESKNVGYAEEGRNRQA